MTDLTPAERDAIIRSDFHSFARWAFGYLNPTTSWADNFHLEATSYKFQLVLRGEKKRLIVTLPPRSLKSLLGSVALPAFALGHDPTKKIICVSYSQVFAEKLAGECRRLMESTYYRSLFRNVRFSKTSAAELETDAGGFRLATSTSGQLTGRGGSLLIIDDPLNAIDAYSKVSRENVNHWFGVSASTRLDDPSSDAIILIAQRLHEDDLIGHLLARAPDTWDVLKLPAVAQEDHLIELDDKRTHVWKRGELLHPSRLPQSWLDHIKSHQGSHFFNTQYLLSPRPETGNLLKVAWLKVVKRIPDRQPGDIIVQSWDTALKAGDTNDYSVCLTFMIRNNNEYYLIDVLRRRLEFPELARLVVSHANTHQASSVLIEDHGSGTSLIQIARHQGVQGIVAIAHHRDKVTRMHDATPKLEARALFILEDAPYYDEFLHEYASFPKSKFDDQMDALSLFLNWRCNRERSSFESDFGHDDGTPNHESISAHLLYRRFG